MNFATIADRTEAVALRELIRKARLQIGALETAKLLGCYLEGAHDHFMDAATGLDDLIADRMADLNRAVAALELFEAAEAYGERPSPVALVADGASL